MPAHGAQRLSGHDEDAARIVWRASPAISRHPSASAEHISADATSPTGTGLTARGSGPCSASGGSQAGRWGHFA